MANTPENPSASTNAENQTPKSKTARAKKSSAQQKATTPKRTARTRRGPAPVAIDALGEFAPPAPRKRTTKAKTASATSEAAGIKNQNDFMKAQARALSAVPMQELLRAQRQMSPIQQNLISQKTGLTTEKPAQTTPTVSSRTSGLVDLVDEEVPSAESFARAAQKLAAASAKELTDKPEVAVEQKSEDKIASAETQTTSETEDIAPAKKPAAKRTSRKSTTKTTGRKKAAAKKDAEEISVEVEPEVLEQSQIESVEEAPAKKKPRRTSRRKKAESDSTAVAQPASLETAADEVVAAQVSEEVPQQEAKPKRVSSRRKKTEALEPEQQTDTETTATEQTKSDQVVELAILDEAAPEEAPAKPKRVSRRKKTTKEPVEESQTPAETTTEAAETTTEAIESQQAQEAPVEEPEEPKRTVRRRRTRKVVLVEEADEATSLSEDEAEPEETAEDKATLAEEVKTQPDDDQDTSDEDMDVSEDSDESDEAAEGEDAEDEDDKQTQRRTHVKRSHASDSSDERPSRHERSKRKILTEPTLSHEECQAMKVVELRAKAEELKLDVKGMRKAELVEAVYKAAARAEGFREIEGMLEITRDGHGYIRPKSYVSSREDAFVPINIVRGVHLRQGDWIQASLRPSRPGDRSPAIGRIKTINGVDVTELGRRPKFADLTPIYPDEQLVMEHGRDSITGRAIDIVSPVGKGQRGLIVSPPKAGKTTVLKHICQSIAANNPEVHLICLLVDERPEEVTDMQRSIAGEVVASTFDMPPENHTRIAELVIERAKRLVEMGEDVVVVLDSITRLARAYNLAAPASGRILSGGVDSASLYPPKRFLGAARNIEDGGSLTILASALIDTGSKMDEVIFEEFKGTGNMELKLDRDLAEKRIFPAIDPVASGTRNEDLLIGEKLRPFVWGIRRILANMNNTERSAASFIKGLKQTDNNEEFLFRSAKKAADHEDSL